MSPHLEIRKGEFSYDRRQGEHPELTRGTFANLLARSLNTLVLRQRYLEKAEESMRETARILESVFPKKVARSIIDTILNGGDLQIEAMGTFLGDFKHDDQKIIYAFSSKDKRFIQDIAHGLARYLETLPSDKALLFLERYLAWLGDGENLEYNTELAVVYPNKAVQLPVMASKNNESVTLAISAYWQTKTGDLRDSRYREITVPANPFAWIDRAKVTLFGFPKFEGRQEKNKQESVFHHATLPYVKLPFDENTGDLILTAREDPSGLGIEIQAGVDEIIKQTPIGLPTIAQFSCLLARLTHPLGMEPQLGEKLLLQQRDYYNQTAKERGLDLLF